MELTVMGMPVSAKATKMPIAIVRAFTKSTPTASPTENSSIASMKATAPVMITNDLISSVSGLSTVCHKSEKAVAHIGLQDKSCVSTYYDM
jgi:hypothetical protein